MSFLFHNRGAGMLVMLMTALCTSAQMQQPAAEAIKTGSISGRVVNVSGQPLPNAAVHVQAVDATRMSEPVTTDREGTFRVTGLKPVLYRVSVYMPAFISVSPDPESAQEKRYKVGDSPTFVLTKGGVITGTVTTAAGNPVAGIRVRARMMRNDKGQRMISSAMYRENATDDRGIYRNFGLPTGTYIVVAGGSDNSAYSEATAFDTYLPTYAPSSTRDTAEEISVRAGEETANIDIRYRAESGRTISGVARTSSGGENLTVNLTSITASGSQSNAPYFQQSGNAGFVFFAVADGDYVLTAETYRQGGEREISESKPINVRGADIEGIELTTRPMGLITGRVVLEESKATECDDKDRPVFKELFVSAWHRQTEAARSLPQYIWNFGQPVSPDPQGSFTVRNLATGQYYFAARFSAKSWYLQSISFASGAKAQPADATRVWTNVKTGDRLSGLTVTLAQGGATLNGQIASREDEMLPEKLFVYLVPAEKEKADDVLRFYGAAVSADRKIAFNSIAPGHYWILAQPAIDEATSPMRKLRWPDETEMRAKLRRDAEAARAAIELKPCQNVVDFRFVP